MGSKFPSSGLLSAIWSVPVLVAAAQTPLQTGKGESPKVQPSLKQWKRQQGWSAGLQKGGSSRERNLDNCVHAAGGERAKIRSNAAGTDRLKPDTLACVFLPLLV